MNLPNRNVIAFAGPQPSDLKQIAQDLNQAFAEFRAKHDQKVDDLSADLDDVIKKIARGGMGGGPRDDDDPRLEQATRAFFARAQRCAPEAAVVDDGALRDYAEAFPMYLRYGQAIANDYRAAMQVGSDPDGGFWTPPRFSMNVLSRIFETSPMRSIASVDSLNTDAIELPIDTDDATTGGWVGETDERPETASPDVGLQSIYMREQYAMPIVTQKLLDDASFNVELWLTLKIAGKLIRDENAAFVSGTGVSQPRGFLDYSGTATTEEDDARAWGKLQYFPVGAAGAFPTISGGASDPDALIDLSLSLKPEFLPNAKWLMRRTTARVVRKLKDADGRYMWLDSLTEGGRPLLLGHEVVLAENMPAVGSDSFSIAFGDFMQGYGIWDHTTGIRILRDNLTTKGKVKFYTTKRTAGDVRNFDAIKLLKFAAS